MALAQKLPAYISPEDYLLLEERSTTKHEYLDGVIYDWQGGVPRAMAGGTVAHATVILNIAIAMRNQLRGKPCKVVSSDVRLSHSNPNAYFYPDVMVSCSPADQTRNDAFSAPWVVFEVLSPSTELFDRGDKFAVYRSIESIETYVLVAPERRTIEVFERGDNWIGKPLQEPAPLEDSAVVELGPAKGFKLSAAEVFEGV